jgi:biofilm PGA synthesis N-glycosyltransferase PgaC
VLAAAVAVPVGIAVPHVLLPPPLAAGVRMVGPTAQQVGTPPVIGAGPLIRVVRLVQSNGDVYAVEPFTGQVLGHLPPEQVLQTGASPYAIQLYGYSATAHRTISLTFDDGPDPVYTPKLLDLLAQHHVPATFFVTGTQMAKYPAIIQREVREGHALGNHSLTHVDVTSTTSLRERIELALTDRIMRAATGSYASYFRLPYEGDDDAGRQDDLPGILRAQQDGYLVASHDFDTEDWAHADGEKTGPIPMPPITGPDAQDNITVLLHDGGGRNRTLTLDYVQKLISLASANGYTFQTMPQVQPWLAQVTGPAKVTVWDRVAFWFARSVYALPPQLLQVLFVLALVTMLGVGMLNTLLALVRAAWGRRRVTGRRPPVSVVIAAFNEELVISRTLDHVLASRYPVREVIVVDDGSLDGTAQVVGDTARRDRRVRLLRQRNAGKWAALNVGYRAARHGHVVTLDADTLFAPDTIGNLMRRFHSPTVGAVAGVIKVGNQRRNVLTRWQALEYVTQIGVDRSAAALLNGVMIVPGACAAWRRDAVLAAGGYSDATLAEDCDLTLALHEHGWRIEQADDAVAYTEAPETADALVKQRTRWMFGTLQATWRHRNLLLNPRHGWLGMVVLPLTIATIIVPLLFTPLIAYVLVAMLVDEGPLPVLGYLGLFAAVYGVLAVVAVLLMREKPRHLAMVPVYRFIYEPLRAYLLYASLGTALRGVRLGWNKLDRTAHIDEPVLEEHVPATAGARS